jgi:hypothetical protein
MYVELWTKLNTKLPTELYLTFTSGQNSLIYRVSFKKSIKILVHEPTIHAILIFLPRKFWPKLIDKLDPRTR